MRSRFEEQLKELNNEMINMGVMIENAIVKAVKALMNKDAELARQIMREDKEIDEVQKKIEAICFNLLIQQQPVAKDLRTITAAMKMVTDMERIGDHAADISEMTIFMGDAKHVVSLDHISKMGAETITMLNHSIEAYVEKDIEKARAVIAYDDVVDDLFKEVKEDIINSIRTSTQVGEEATDLLMVAKYFERIGDHATNIAEWVIYSLENIRRPVDEE